MQKYLLDTDFLIDFFRNKENTIKTFEKLSRYQKVVSVVTLAEFLVGCFKSENPQQQKKQIYQFLSINKIRVLGIYRNKTVTVYAEIRAMLEKLGQKLSNFDLLIAATALSQNLVLVTGNKEHFQRIKNLNLL